MNGGPVAALREDFLRLYPSDAAGVLELRSAEEVAEVLAGEPPRVSAVVLGALGAEIAARALGSLSGEVFAEIAEELDSGKAAMLLSRLPPEEREERLALLSGGTAREIRELMTYPPQSAGHLMDPRATTFRATTTAEEALRHLRTLRETELDDVFIVDAEGRFVGAVALGELALAAPERPLGELGSPSVETVQVTAGLEEVLEITGGRTGAVPVVDFDGFLVGLIRPRELLSVAEEEASVSVQTMVGVSREERALSSAGFAVRRRLPWLFINLLTAFTAAGVVGVFESTIARVSALAVLMPVVAGQSGNSGAQALAVAMRGLALREIRLPHWRRLVLKEAAVGLANGVVIAVATGVGVAAWSRSIPLGAVIAMAMVLSMTVAGIAGASVPMGLKALGQDPAQSSSIVLTTVTDVVGFLTFLGLATLLAAQL